MGMLFARRRREQVENVTTTENLLQQGTDNTKPKTAKNVPVEPKKEETTSNLKFKV